MHKKPISKQSLATLLGFLRPHKARCAIAAGALLFTSIVTLLIGQGVRLILDNGFTSGSTAELGQWVSLLLFMALMLSVGTFIRFYSVSWLGERVSADLRASVFNRIISMDPGFFDRNRSGEITSRLTTDTTLLQSIIGSAFSMALRSSITSAGAVVMLFLTNLKLTLVILAAVPLVLMPVLLFGKRVRRLSKHSQDSVANVGAQAGEIIQQIRVVQSYTNEEREKRAFSEEVEQTFQIGLRRIFQRGLLMAAVILMVFAALSAMLWIGGSDVIRGAMTVGELGAFVFYALLVATGVATLSEVYGELQRALGATERLVQLLNETPRIQVPDATRFAKRPQLANEVKADIEFDEVEFSYPTRADQPALKHFSVFLPEASVTAVVGPSGAGKSTLFELLQRFYDPNQGEIRFGGQRLGDFDPRELRTQFALVSQQPGLFTANVADNIAYGIANPLLSDIEQAARAAQAHEFISALPDGYDTDLGEQGARLSGGQRQRIAIARALLKNPRVLLLDEATSALDTESEYQIQKALQQLMLNRTTIIIAHRLSTVIHADRILVMDQGQLLASGTHRELLSTSELYARLVERQFLSMDTSNPTAEQTPQNEDAA